MMKYFLETVDTIEPGKGFTMYGPLHLAWLAFFLVVTVSCCAAYRHHDAAWRGRWRKVVAGLLVGDELFKDAMLLIGGNFSAEYLPLHLCSINIILIAIHAWKPSKTLDNFLCLICIPGACAALLFPTWTELPFLNFMHLHSFTVHTMLALYPIVLTVARDIRLEGRYIPRCLLLLLLMAGPIYLFNLKFGTNFMFLMYAEPGNPLYWFQVHWGSHLYGFPVIIAALLAVVALLKGIGRLAVRYHHHLT
jgi:hypothetical integral membrane protein (TIGR02206 family)